MATYNGAKYIREQLESIRQQTVQPFELVVCDDGSTDGTLDVVRAFADSCGFDVRINENEVNLGFSDNFLRCASLCRGDWIAFCDQDDFWLPEKLSKVSDAIRRAEAGSIAVVCHSGLVADEDLKPTGVRVPDYQKRMRVRRQNNYGFICIPGFTITFRATILSEVDSSERPSDYFDRRAVPLSHDKWVPLLGNLFGDIIYLAEPLALYRRHGAALSGSYDAQTAKDLIAKSLKVGSDHYKFQSGVAAECASSLERIAQYTSDSERKIALVRGAERYRKLSRVCLLRERVYSSTRFTAKVANIVRLLGIGGYWGDRFVAYGMLSLAKDVYRALR